MPDWTSRWLLRLVNFTDADGAQGLVCRALGLLNLWNSMLLAAKQETVTTLK